MTIVRLIACSLFFQLAGCVHVAESFHTQGEADIQEIYATSHQFMGLKIKEKVKRCKASNKKKGAQRDRLANIKQAFMIALYPSCGDLDEAISLLKKAKLARIDRGFEQFLNYHIVLIERLKREVDVSSGYQKRLKKLAKKESVLLEKLDEIKSIEKTLNNRDD